MMSASRCRRCEPHACRLRKQSGSLSNASTRSPAKSCLSKHAGVLSRADWAHRLPLAREGKETKQKFTHHSGGSCMQLCA